MLITGIETFSLRIPFKPGQASAASGRDPGDPPAVDSLLVKVTTDQGYEGWGEAFGFGATAATQRAIDDLIAPLCIGQDPSRIAPLMHAVQEELQVFGRGGLVTHALSAVDIALWDIAGKVADAPLHRLLGGRRRRSGLLRESRGVCGSVRRPRASPAGARCRVQEHQAAREGAAGDSRRARGGGS